MIETIAIRIGTNASSEANTNASTTQRPEAAEHRLEQDARAAAATRLVLERVETGHLNRRAPDSVAREDRRGRLGGLRVRPERLVVRRRVGEHERRAPVGGHERAVAGRRERRGPASGEGSLQLRRELVECRA